jgi:hypothetical protein
MHRLLYHPPPLESAPHNHCIIGGRVGPRASLDTLQKRRISCLCWESTQFNTVPVPFIQHWDNLSATSPFIYILVSKQASLLPIFLNNNVCISIFAVHDACQCQLSQLHKPMKDVTTSDDQFDLVYILTTDFPSIHFYTLQCLHFPSVLFPWNFFK